MILWTFKLINSVRKAIAGRKHPGQLAWGVALGALLGMIPHGNLLAVVLVLFVLMLQVNHAMAALVGVAVMFLAPHLDPTFDALGRWCFAQPQLSDRMALAWQYPLVPWTDLNNTIVMGSFLVGLVSVGPLFMVSYPLFRAWAPADVAAVDAATADPVTDTSGDAAEGSEAARPNEKPSITDSAAEQTLARIDARHTNSDGRDVQSDEPRNDPAVAASYCMSCENSRSPATTESAQPHSQPSLASRGPRPTRVAMISSPSRPFMTTQALLASRAEQSTTAGNSHESPANDQRKIDEALSYLLRQLRDSQDKDAA